MASAPEPERDQAEAFTDWEKVLHGLAVFGLAIYAVMVPGAVNALAHALDYLYSRSMPGMGLVSLLDGLLIAAYAVCQMVSVAWLFWGVTCLGTGPRYRWLVLILVWTGLVLSALALVAALLQDRGPYSSEGPGLAVLTRIMSNNERMGGKPELLQIVLTFALYPAVMLLVVTRPAVKAVFTYRPRRRRSEQ
jgi:hypothetical protein